MLGWRKHKLESRFPGEISSTSDMLSWWLPLGFSGGFLWASLVAQTVKNSPAVQETWVQSLGWEDPLEKSMATHSSILSWRIPTDRRAWWATVMGSQRVGYNWVTNTHKVGTVTDILFLGSKITADGDCSQEIKRRLLLGRKAMTNLDGEFSSSHVQMWELDHKESRVLKNWCFWIVALAGEDSWETLGQQGDQTSQC